MNLDAEQLDDVAFLLEPLPCGSHHKYLANVMGCVAGETVIAFNRASKGFKLPISKAYEHFHHLRETQKNQHWDRNIPTFARCLKDGEFRLGQVRDILKVGIRPVVKLKFESGKVLRVTPDHKICTPGGWVAAKDMFGKLALSNGKFVDKDGYVRVSGNQGHPRSFNGGVVFERLLVMEKHLGFPVPPHLHVHHKDENPSNNDISNLELLTPTEHHREHKRYRNMASKFIPKLDWCWSVSLDGEAEVYDISMLDECENFTANKIVVHNCGKTVVAAVAASQIKTATFADENGFPRWVQTGLIICPASIKDGYQAEATAWKQQLVRWGGYKENDIQVIETGADYPKAPIIIVNPELLVRSKPLQKALFKRRFDFCIVDEAHVLKGLSSQITKLVLYGGRDALISRARYKWLLSGSPVPNRAIELFPPIMALCPELIAPYNDRDSFATYFCGGFHDGHEIAAPGFTNADELAERLKPFMRRREHAEGALPDCTERDVFLDVGFPKDLDASNTPIATLRKLVGEAKLPHVIEYVRAKLISGSGAESAPEKILVFTYSRAVTETLTEALSDFNAVSYYGALSTKQKGENKSRFINDSSCRVFVAQLQSAGQGIDGLQLVCNYGIYAEEDWTEEYVAQQIARLLRRGQTKPVHFDHLIAKGTYDDKIVRARLKKDAPVKAFFESLKLPTNGEVTPQQEKEVMALEDVLKEGFAAVCAAIDANTAALKLVSSFASGSQTVEETGKKTNGRGGAKTSKDASADTASAAATAEQKEVSAEDLITAATTKLLAICGGQDPPEEVGDAARKRIKAAIAPIIGDAMLSDTPAGSRAAVLAAINAVDGSVIKPAAKAGLGI